MTSVPTTASRLDGLRDAAREAWFFTLPLIEMAMTRSREAAKGGRLNTLSHVRDLLTHTARLVTMPNNDTLYSSAHLDLSQVPVTLSVPPSGDRYLSVALMDMYTNNFAILGSRTTGPYAKGATGLNSEERRRLQRQEDRLREARVDALNTAAERLQAVRA